MPNTLDLPAIAHDPERLDRRLIVSQEGKDLVLPAQPTPDPVLVQAIGRSFSWKKLLEKSPELTIRDLAKQCGYSDRYLSRQLPLTGLAPDILHRALSGTLPSTVTLYGLEEASAYLSWNQQRAHLGLN